MNGLTLPMDPQELAAVIRQQGHGFLSETQPAPDAVANLVAGMTADELSAGTSVEFAIHHDGRLLLHLGLTPDLQLDELYLFDFREPDIRDLPTSGPEEADA